MIICGHVCPYNTLDGCKVKEYMGVCPLTNTVKPIKEYKMTNADRIRSMSDEELARWLEYEGGGACAEMCGWLNWLQQPAEEG